MGCCLSSPTTTKTPKSDPNLSHSGAPAPPPPLIEEETVKEVLTETAIPKILIPTANDNDGKINQLDRVVEETMVEPTAEIKPSEDIVSEVISEMCSFSESLSAATEKRDDDGEVTQRVRRTPPKVIRRPPVRSPARRSEPSPVKRTHGQGRTMTTAEAARRNIGPLSTGEGSGRRSKSPATRSEAGPRRPVRYRSPSMVPGGKSEWRSPAETADSGGKGEGLNGGVSTETTELLENPLVSLECFIFL